MGFKKTVIRLGVEGCGVLGMVFLPSDLARTKPALLGAWVSHLRLWIWTLFGLAAHLAGHARVVIA